MKKIVLHLPNDIGSEVEAMSDAAEMTPAAWVEHVIRCVLRMDDEAQADLLYGTPAYGGPEQETSKRYLTHGGDASGHFGPYAG